MIPMVSTTVRVAAHALHYAITVGGLIGVAAFLLPHRLHAGAPRRPAMLTEHDRRVADLRAAFAPADPPRAHAGHAGGRNSAAERPSASLVPVALVLTAAAATVHAAVCPDHFREGLLLGLFFLGAALGQLAGTLAVLRFGATRALVVAGGLGNLACVALWGWTRVVGVPFGLGDGREPVGAWDVAAAAFELGAAAACALILLRGAAGTRAAGWQRWAAPPRVALGASVLVVAGLSLAGVGA